MAKTKQPAYYVLEAENPNRMLLQSLPDPSIRDLWLVGKSFSKRPVEPVIARIVAGYEKAELMPYFGTPPVMSNDFYQALVAAGVDNLEVFDAVLKSQDGKVEYTGLKAFNLIGLVKAADLKETKFAADNESRFIDASIERLTIDSEKARGFLMFRLAEYSGAIIVNEKIKQVIEKHGFPHMVFRQPEDFLS